VTSAEPFQVVITDHPVVAELRAAIEQGLELARTVEAG